MEFREWIEQNDFVNVNGIDWWMPNTLMSDPVIVVASIPKVDALWRQTTSYISSSGKGDIIGNRYQKIEKAIASNPKSFTMPVIRFSHEPNDFAKRHLPNVKYPLITIIDGRHRLAAFRDAGWNEMPFTISFSQAKEFDRVCGVPRS
jgi:hypothetical protein